VSGHAGHLQAPLSSPLNAEVAAGVARSRKSPLGSLTSNQTTPVSAGMVVRSVPSDWIQPRWSPPVEVEPVSVIQNGFFARA
jgi:hypothetical protein